MRALDIPGVVLLALLGVLLGVSAYTFYYARGYSYLSNDPTACVNCHVMRDKFDAWQVSPHRFALCNDCHVPHNLVGKYAVKMEHGIRHSYVFTFGNPQIFRLKDLGLQGGGRQLRALPRHRGLDRSCTAAPASAAAFECHQGMGHAF